MKNLKAFFVIVLFLGLIFSFQESLAAEITCEEVCDTFGWQYNVYECIDDFEGDCSSYAKFDSNYCYYDCITGSSGVLDIPDCDSNTCICIKKTSCDSSKNNCYDQTGCTSCEERSVTGSCQTSADCCQQPDILMCDSETKLCYNPNNNFICISNRNCYSDEECMSGKCDFEGTGECECSDRGGVCEDRNDQCADDLRCNDDYSVCYDRDLDLAVGKICYHNSECESDSCNFNEQGTSGVCSGIDGGGDEPPPNGSEPEEPESEPKKPPKPGTCEYYCFDNTEPPEGMVCICNPLSADSFEEIIDSLIDLIFSLSLVIAPLMIVWAGGLYVTSGGNSEQITKAKNIIIYTLTGFAVILLSKGFVAIIKQLLGA